MKYLLLIVSLMTATISNGQPKATTIKKTFSRETVIQNRIYAAPAIVWELLTNAPGYPRWNSTVTSIQGTIAKGEKIILRSILDEKRSFKLRIKELEPEKHMIWGDGKGNRTYTLTKNDDNSVTFEMKEKIGGFMFPMYAKYIPPFDTVFEQFAADLKKEAELIQKTKK